MDVETAADDHIFLNDKDKKKGCVTKKFKEKGLISAGANRTVFDRLLSPSNLTGTQKQRFNRIHDQKGRTLEKAIENQHVALRGKSRSKRYESDESDDDREVTSSDYTRFEEYSRLDVFERLNKTTTQAYKEKVHTNIAEKMLNDLLSDGEEEKSVDYESENKSELRFQRVKEYAREDVFERLQRNTTEAYATKTKHHPYDDAHAPGSPNNCH